jgi:hypothetical protein
VLPQAIAEYDNVRGVIDFIFSRREKPGHQGLNAKSLLIERHCAGLFKPPVALP